MTSTPERREEIGAFFAANADRLRHAVRHQIRSPRDEIVDDACQFAWTVLVRRPDIDLRGTGLAWLRTVAVNEARRLSSTARETPAGAFLPHPDLQHGQGEMAEPADIESRGADEQALAHIEHRERKQALHALKPREREALYLKGMGYSYQEIMRLTDSTYTAVNRRIAEGRAALRRHMGDDGGPRRSERRARSVERTTTADRGESTAPSA